MNIDTSQLGFSRHPVNHSSLRSREIQLWKVRSSNDAKLDAARNLLSRDDQIRASHIRSAHKRRQFLLGRFALKQSLEELNEPLAEPIRVDIGANGKPLLQDQSNPIRFNLSHADTVSVLALAKQRELGIDIEKTVARKDLLEAASMVFSDKEMAGLMTCSQQAQTNMFYRIWCHKEALIKWIGSGFSIEASSLCLAKLMDQSGDFRRGQPTLDESVSVRLPEKLNFLELSLESNHLVVICFDGD